MRAEAGDDAGADAGDIVVIATPSKEFKVCTLRGFAFAGACMRSRTMGASVRTAWHVLTSVYRAKGELFVRLLFPISELDMPIFTAAYPTK